MLGQFHLRIMSTCTQVRLEPSRLQILVDYTKRLLDHKLIFLFQHLFLFSFFFVSFLADHGNGKVGKKTHLKHHLPRLPNLGDRQEAFNIHFDYDADFGIPGAFYIKSKKQVEFFLVSLTLEDIPNHGTIHFVCNSWVYNSKRYGKRDRIFFANDVSLYLASWLQNLNTIF